MLIVEEEVAPCLVHWHILIGASTERVKVSGGSDAESDVVVDAARRVQHEVGLYSGARCVARFEV